MTPDQQALWQRIEAHAFDDPTATRPFTLRLAQENGWSLGFARQALAEYRRFVFLATAAGHPVSPSDAVDQVWHLHLLYTVDYWGEFCPRVLGAPLHHGPTRGGGREREKFGDWYAQTRASYRRFFGEPPDDLWPVQPRHPHATRVDLDRHWVVRKPAWLAQVRAWWDEPRRTIPAAGLRAPAAGGVSAMALIVAGMLLLTPHRAEAATGVGLGWPFNLNGPEFLTFFLCFAPVVFVSAAVLRWYASGPAGEAARAEELDAYEVAHLAGGKKRVLGAILSHLCNEELIVFSMREVKRTEKPAPAGLPVLESVTLAAIPPSGVLPERLLETIDHALEANANTLAHAGMMVTPQIARTAWLGPLLLALMVPLCGVVKIMVGLARMKPVGYLVFLTLVGLVLALAIFARRPRLTRRGRATLARLRDQHSGLQNLKDATVIGGLGDGMLPMVVGLYGLDVLTGTALADVPQQMRLPRQPGDSISSDGGWSSTDSGGGDSGGGGGGDGGGGDGGGGGCGGCGGGGGD